MLESCSVLQSYWSLYCSVIFIDRLSLTLVSRTLGTAFLVLAMYVCVEFSFCFWSAAFVWFLSGDCYRKPVPLASGRRGRLSVVSCSDESNFQDAPLVGRLEERLM